MKNGFYLSVYTQIDELAKAYKIHERHDQHMALWLKSDNNIELVHYWEFERITGLKKHSVPFENVSEAIGFINRLLSKYNLTIDDMIEIWGTPELEKFEANYTTLDMFSNYTYHSICHLFSSMFQDTDVFYNNKILALAVDAGPDNLIDYAAKNKNYYTGAFSNNGSLKFFHIPSPACLWAFMTYKFNLQEGTLMALGTASKSELLCAYQDFLNGFVPVKNMADGGITFEWFNHFVDEVMNLSANDETVKFNVFDPNFTEVENKISMVVKVIQQISCDVLSDTINNAIDEYEIDPSETYLSMSGGFTLNCPTNTYLMDKYSFKGFLAPPCVSDCGIALGMGIYAFYKNLGTFNFKLKNAYYGDDDSSLQKNINSDQFSRYIKSINDFDECTFFEDIEKEPIVWFNDRSEIGPRALGNRSILADPRKIAAKDKLNIIKQRQWWRPVAPIILEEMLPEWFNAIEPSEYMLKTYIALDDKKEAIPAILHIDGTARVQTVNKQNKDLYELVNIFYKRTQIPILCNTSLNDRGEPIINNISESLNFALRKGIRIVYINRKRVELIHHTEFPSKQVEPRYSGKFDNAIPDTRLKELNPYDLSMDEIEFYLNHPQLRSYKINDKEQVEKVKKMIKYLKKVQWNSALNKIIK